MQQQGKEAQEVKDVGDSYGGGGSRLRNLHGCLPPSLVCFLSCCSFMDFSKSFPGTIIQMSFSNKGIFNRDACLYQNLHLKMGFSAGIFSRL